MIFNKLENERKQKARQIVKNQQWNNGLESICKWVVGFGLVYLICHIVYYIFWRS